MSIIIDLIILGILVLCIALGYHKGLTGSLLKIISFVLALVIAFVLFKPVSSFIIDKTNWDENLEQGIRDVILAKDEQEVVKEDEQEKQSMPDVMIDYINKTVEDAGDNAKETIAEATSRDMAVTIIHAGVWIGLFLIARIILFFVKGLANLITKLPVIKQFDKLGGILYGMLEGVVIIYGILAILSFVSPTLNNTGILSAVQESFMGSVMYNNNLLLKLIF